MGKGKKTASAWVRLGVPFLQKSLVSPFARPCTAQLLNRKIDGATYFLLINFGYCRDREKLAKKCLPFCSMVSSNGNIVSSFSRVSWTIFDTDFLWPKEEILYFISPFDACLAGFVSSWLWKWCRIALPGCEYVYFPADGERGLLLANVGAPPVNQAGRFERRMWKGKINHMHAERRAPT